MSGRRAAASARRLSDRRKAALLALACSLAACAPSGAVVVDLIEQLPHAEVFVESGLIDVGTPAGRPHLVDGFLDADELWANRPDQTFVWAIGESATIRFFVFEPRDLVLLLTARPNPREDATSVSGFRALVNDTPLSRLDVVPGWSTYRVTVPHQILVAGENLLTLAFDDGQGAIAGIDRRLAVDRVELERTVVTYPPRRELGGRVPSLVVPYLSGVWYDLDVPERARLRIDAIRAYGPHDADPEGSLVVVLGDPPDTTRQAVSAGHGVDLSLPSGRLRLGLLSVPGGDANARADQRQNEEAVGLVLLRPRIVADR